jgi:hypothetical protein
MICLFFLDFKRDQQHKIVWETVKLAVLGILAQSQRCPAFVVQDMNFQLL